MLIFLENLFQKTVAAANDASECPDGNDGSVGAGISSFTASLSANGRILPTHGFKIILHIRSPRISANESIIPDFLYLGIIRSTAAAKIQIKPILPSLVKNGTEHYRSGKGAGRAGSIL